MKQKSGAGKSAWRTRAFWLSPPAAGCAALLALMAVWLFALPHGLGDNGDFYRVIHNLGLSHPSGSHADTYFSYFNDRFVLSRYDVQDKVPYFSAQTPVVWLSVLLSRPFLPAGVYDIRFLGGIYAALFLTASFLLLRLLDRLTLRQFAGASPAGLAAARWLFAALYVLVFGDFGYLLYFNSFFGEPLFYTAALLYAALVGWMLVEKRCTVPLLLASTAAAALMIGAKQQGAPLALAVAVLTLRLLTLRKGMRWRVPAAACALCAVLVGVGTYAGINDQIRYLNQYHEMTLGVMKYEPDASQLKTLGVPPQMMILRDTTAFDEYPVILPDAPLMYSQMYDRVSVVTVLGYYVRRPGSLRKVFDDEAAVCYTVRPRAVGNFLKSAGHPPLAQSGFFTAWSAAKERIFPKTFSFLLLSFLTLAGLLLVSYVGCTRRGEQEKRRMIEFAWGVEAMAAIQFVTATVGAGESDLAKHLFYFTVFFDMLFVLSVYAAVRWVYRISRKRR